MNSPDTQSSIKEVFHPINLLQEDKTAFYHALKLAVLAEAKLTMFYVNTGSSEVSSDDFPSTTRTLETWRINLAESKFSSKIVSSKSSDPVDSALFHLEHSPADLIVMATRAKSGLSRLMERAIAQPIASESGACVLFLPEHATGFVDPATGELNLRRILVPVSTYPDPNPTLKYLSNSLKLMKNHDAMITLLHVGDESSWPEKLMLPEFIANRCTKVTKKGQIVNEIRKQAEEESPDLIVLTTQGKRGLVKLLLGGNADQLLRTAQCAVFGVPCEEPIDHQD